jgi:hypothetical protein
VVLVEGPSDAAVVCTLVRSRGLAPATVTVTSMGGVTNLGHHLRANTDHGRAPAVLGLCDAAEAPVVVNALRRHGQEVTGPDDLERPGFYLCVRDLEDELVRSLGVAAVEAVLGEIGELGSFRTFQQQPGWRGRDPADQLRRFAGAGSGRKLAFATGLAARLRPASTPRPLALLLGRAAELVSRPDVTEGAGRDRS